MDECTGSTIPKETDENNSNAQANRINAMIKELAELRVNYHKARKTRNYCWAQESTLSVNIALTKMKCENLRKRETDLKVLTSEIIKQEEIIQQDLKNLMSQRMLRTLKKRDEFQHIEREYHDKFINARKEYSSESLCNDIKKYQEEYKKINNELSVLKEQLKDLQTQCGLYNLYNEEHPEIVKIDELTKRIRKDADYNLGNITATEDMLKNLEKQIQDTIRKTQMLKKSQMN